MPEERPPVEGLSREDDGTSGKSNRGHTHAAHGLSIKGQGGKRIGRREFDSSMTTKDIVTGVPISSAGRSLSFGEDGTSLKMHPLLLFLQTLYLMRIRIYPRPHVQGRFLT